MYFGPLMVFEKYNLNIFVSALVMTSSELFVYPITYFWLDKMERKLFGKILCGVTTICSLFLYFIVGDSNEDEFWKFI